MTTIRINTKKNVIEMSNAFAKAAKNVGSEEYKTLQEARRDYPNFRVETKKAARKTATNSFKGLTYDYMEKYISKHDDEDQSIMNEFKMLRGESEEAEEMLAESCSYNEIKTWFFKKYPEIEKFHEMRAKMLAA